MNVLPDSEQDLAARLRSTANSSEYVEEVLTTNERVIARVTDGIYRQPGSAIRELISNAYDADATWVSVKTDAPQFSRMTIEDDGVGMSPEAVIHLLNNIGGSSKRTEQGQELGVVSEDDPTLSPGGRKVIGKLGIGIFSVSQLTSSFQIVTKTAGDTFQTVVMVRLRQFSDEPADGDETAFNAGSYRVWREPTGDHDGHGTTIILNAIRPQTRDSLRSQQMWSALDNDLDEGDSSKSPPAIPLYHIGRVGEDGALRRDPKSQLRNVPWQDGDSPDVAFSGLVDSVWRAASGRTTVKLADLFDSYLQMVWNLALSLPLEYVDVGLLDETVSDDWAYFYKISNGVKGVAQRLLPDPTAKSLRELAGLASRSTSEDVFRVFVDGLELRRPIKYRDLPSTSHVLTRPMAFVGAMREDFTGFSKDVSAGPLDFEAYLFWTPKVAPTEHQGALVRIHGASGTLFDSTFMGYQVSELTRLRQITCEIYVKQGLEAALNIDRESFNTAHPHTVVLTRWLHSALRQLATAQKREAQTLRVISKEIRAQNLEEKFDLILSAANDVRTGGEGLLSSVSIVTRPEAKQDSAASTDLVYSLPDLVREIPFDKVPSPKSESIRKVEAIASVLSIYGALDTLNAKERENLLGSILGILEAENVGF